ncbi:hypothetical protein BTUL_0068g00440 [Botrytis tulipae]|uniref:Uncharacterized protein n=1 Tax=Botrytis tulipae TaxID=87230 RepID=A0A4Z1EMI1_9HELO|nr:hypothetical protein BTUL_0068g00440 [Botrytis tulipae]
MVALPPSHLGMGLLDFIRRKIKGSRHENHTSHAQKSSKIDKTHTSYRSKVPNDGSSRGRPQDPQQSKRAPLSQSHKGEHRNEKSVQPRHVDKRSYSVKDRIKCIENDIYKWNKENPPNQRVKIDIIILQGLLDVNQHLSEPRSSSQIRFIYNPEELWGESNLKQLQIACKEKKWHADFSWSPYTLKSGVRKRLFEATAKDVPVYKSNKEVLIIRGPPLDYQICQRIDHLRRLESETDLYNSELSKILKYIESCINEQQLNGTRSKSRRDVTPRELIEKWQKEYCFDFSKVLRSLKDKRVERPEPRGYSGTRIHQKSHKVNGPHDSAVSLPTSQRAPSKSRAYNSSNHGSESDTSTSTRSRRVLKPSDSAVSLSGTRERAQSKSQAHKPSDDVTGGVKSIHPRRRTSNSSQPLNQHKPQTKPNRDTLAKNFSHSRPSITIDSPSEGRGRYSSKSPNRKPPGRSPRTPLTPRTPRTPQSPQTSLRNNHVYQDRGKPPLPPSLYSSDHGRQKSPARPRSSNRKMTTRERSHGDFPDPSTSQSQSQSHLHVNSHEMRPRNSYPDLVNNTHDHYQQQLHSTPQLHSPYVIRKDRYPRPSNEDPNLPSPVESTDMSWKDGRTREQIDEIHRQEYKQLKSEDGIS